MEISRNMLIMFCAAFFIEKSRGTVLTSVLLSTGVIDPNPVKWLESKWGPTAGIDDHQEMNWKYVTAGKSCTISPKLRDKWLFTGQTTKSCMRIREHALIYINKETRQKVRYKCVERRGDIYLMRTSKTPGMKKGVLCLGFSYLGISPFVEYGMMRLNTNGNTFSLISPKPVKNVSSISIDESCDLLNEPQRVFAYIKRATAGCKFPKVIRREWNYTYMRALKITFGPNTMKYLLTDHSTIQLTCDKRDRDIFLLRIKNYNNSTQDAIVCYRLIPLKRDPFYAYKVSRLNSGDVFDGKFRLVPTGKPMHIHQDCDWMDSPGRPEFLYP